MTDAAKPARVGLFGGTFNPVHMGHLRAAEEVSERLDLERLVFLPCAQPPHKRGTGEVIAPAHERLEWVRLAIAGNPRFAVDPIELARKGLEPRRRGTERNGVPLLARRPAGSPRPTMDLVNRLRDET